MANLIDLPFNSSPSFFMHIDLNSCFATVEQQANPFLRGKPIAVAAYDTPSGCILAASVEAKKLGVKTGMRVKDGRLFCPNLTVLTPDPEKYRHVHRQLKRLLSNYTPDVVPKSIDEFVLNFSGCPAFKLGLHQVAATIKSRIKQEIGEWLTVSIGLGPNRFLAKTASNLHKPDGLDEINFQNFTSVYAGLALTDLCGIKTRNALRLNQVGIYTVSDFYRASVRQLRAAFHSINGLYWYLKLHGYTDCDVDFDRKSFGNSYALPKPLVSPESLSPILHQLTQKCGTRLRSHGYSASGIHLGLVFRDGIFWHQGKKLPGSVFDSRDIYKEAFRLLLACPHRAPVREISVSCFRLTKKSVQLELFSDVVKKSRLVSALDSINDKWGKFTVTTAQTLNLSDPILDRIAFGSLE